MRPLFDILREPKPLDWTPPQPPCLDNVTDVEIDVESSGIRWWSGDYITGIAVGLPDGTTYYLPIRHLGGNLDESVVIRWAQRELRGKHITNINTRFDLHMLYQWGVDLESQHCTFSDVGHMMALLDDHRNPRDMSLDAIARDILSGEQKVTGLDKTRMADYHAGEVAAYAEHDTRLVRLIKNSLLPRIHAEDLTRVLELENAVIPVVCEMERNGTYIDTNLLDRWIPQAKTRAFDLLRRVAYTVGFQVNPDSPKDMTRLFRHLGLPLTLLDSGRGSFTDDVLKAHRANPIIADVRLAGKLLSLSSKFLVGTQKSLDAHGVLRYALHQLQAQRSDADETGVGTVSGRFSSSGLTRDYGCNIQQRSKPEKQRVSFGYADDDDSHDDDIFLIRKLHIAKPGHLFFSSDMMQVEYRIFASLAGNPAILRAYQDNPRLSFHKHVHAMLSEYKPVPYSDVKNLNFAYLYGAGLPKMAHMMGYITQAELRDIQQDTASRFFDPRLQQPREIRRHYEELMPEAKRLLQMASHLAMPKCNDRCNTEDTLHAKVAHRGYVRTLLGRRARFPFGQRTHKGLNAIIQGTGADILKQKLVEVHRERKRTGFVLSASVHDEIIGSAPSRESARMVDEILNRQSFPQIKVPLLWESGIGPNWAECEDL